MRRDQLNINSFAEPDIIINKLEEKLTEDKIMTCMQRIRAAETEIRRYCRRVSSEKVKGSLRDLAAGVLGADLYIYAFRDAPGIVKYLSFAVPGTYPVQIYFEGCKDDNKEYAALKQNLKKIANSNASEIEAMLAEQNKD